MIEPNLDKLRVLIVVEDAFMEMTLRAQLDASGIGPVHVAPSPEGALEALRSWRPGLVICDHSIEPASGLGMIRSIRADTDSPFRAIPIILLAGFKRSEVLQGALWTAGVDAILDTPVTARRLHDCIQSLRRTIGDLAGDGSIRPVP